MYSVGIIEKHQCWPTIDGQLEFVKTNKSRQEYTPDRLNTRGSLVNAVPGADRPLRVHHARTEGRRTRRRVVLQTRWENTVYKRESMIWLSREGIEVESLRLGSARCNGHGVLTNRTKYNQNSTFKSHSNICGNRSSRSPWRWPSYTPRRVYGRIPVRKLSRPRFPVGHFPAQFTFKL